MSGKRKMGVPYFVKTSKSIWSGTISANPRVLRVTSTSEQPKLRSLNRTDFPILNSESHTRYKIRPQIFQREPDFMTGAPLLWPWHTTY